jgi:hypothetical protein
LIAALPSWEVQFRAAKLRLYSEDRNIKGPDESGPFILVAPRFSDVNREVRLDGIESQGEPVAEHAPAEAEAGVVQPVSAVQQVATAAVMEPAVFPVAPFV